MGAWNESIPFCEGTLQHLQCMDVTTQSSNLVHNTTFTVIITCQPLTQPSNETVTISPGTHRVTLGIGELQPLGLGKIF